jgi:hypothetical protein
MTLYSTSILIKKSSYIYVAYYTPSTTTWLDGIIIKIDRSQIAYSYIRPSLCSAMLYYTILTAIDVIYLPCSCKMVVIFFTILPISLTMMYEFHEISYLDLIVHYTLFFFSRSPTSRLSGPRSVQRTADHCCPWGSS